MPTQQPIVIRGSGTTNAATTWICAAAVAGLLLTAAISFHRWGGMALLAAWLAALFGCMLLFTATQRVELNGDEISYQNLLKRRRSLRLDQIRSVRGTIRSGKGGAFLLFGDRIDRPPDASDENKNGLLLACRCANHPEFLRRQTEALREEEMIAAGPVKWPGRTRSSGR
jgi:hypothetical protein